MNKKLSCRRKTARCISLSHSRSLKVVENGNIRKLGYGFLFAFYSNYGSVLYNFKDKARYYPLAFDTLVMGSPSEYCHSVRYIITKIVLLHGGEKSLMIYLAVLIPATGV